MLPTNEKAKPGNIVKSKFNDIHTLTKNDGKEYTKTTIPQHLYILSDDEIKEDDWIYHKLDDKPIQVGEIELETLITCSNSNQYNYKKIIATTDESISIVKDSIRISQGRFDNVYRIEKRILPQPSQSFIKKYIEEYNKGNVITDVMVEYEIDEINELSSGDNISETWLKVDSKDNTITIKKVKDSWNKTEIIDLIQSKINDYQKEGASYGILFILKDWIKENL